MGSRNCIYIGIDPMVGIDRPFLSNLMLDWLHEKHFVTLQDIYVTNNKHTSCWLSSSNLGLPMELDLEWNAYVDSLYNAGFILNTDRDVIVWGVNQQTGIVKANLAYLHFLKEVKVLVCS